MFIWFVFLIVSISSLIWMLMEESRGKEGGVVIEGAGYALFFLSFIPYANVLTGILLFLGCICYRVSKFMEDGKIYFVRTKRGFKLEYR